MGMIQIIDFKNYKFNLINNISPVYVLMIQKYVLNFIVIYRCE